MNLYGGIHFYFLPTYRLWPRVLNMSQIYPKLNWIYCIIYNNLNVKNKTISLTKTNFHQKIFTQVYYDVNHLTIGSLWGADQQYDVGIIVPAGPGRPHEGFSLCFMRFLQRHVPKSHLSISLPSFSHTQIRLHGRCTVIQADAYSSGTCPHREAPSTIVL